MPISIGTPSDSSRTSPLGSILLTGRVVNEGSAVQRPSRSIDSWVLSAVHAGAGEYRDETGRRVDLSPGSVIVLPPGLRHWYGTVRGGAWTESWAIFRGPLFDLHETSDPRVASGPHAVNGPAQTVFHVGERSPLLAAIPLLIGRTVLSELARQHQLLDLFGLVMDIRATADTSLPGPIEAAAAILAEDLRAQLSMVDVAATVGMGYEAFRRAFRAAMGVAPAAYRTHQRMETAANLLKMTELKHRAIARQLGFTDEFHFSRQFKATFGMSPSTFRGSHGHVNT